PSTLNVHVKVSSNTTATTSLTITIDAPAPVPTRRSSELGTVGVAYSQTLTASGGTGGYQWSVPPGSLPAGLALNGAVISGNPTTVGTSTLNAQVKDSSSITATKSLKITIDAAALVITTSS